MTICSNGKIEMVIMKEHQVLVSVYNWSCNLNTFWSWLQLNSELPIVTNLTLSAFNFLPDHDTSR